MASPWTFPNAPELCVVLVTPTVEPFSWAWF
jgi:hypothetical protein